MNILSIADVAKELEIEPATLRHHLRNIAGIAKHGRNWLLTPRDLPRVRKHIERARAGRNNWGPKSLAMLGKMTDAAVAERLGISQPAVTNKRNAQKIPPFQPATSPAKAKKRRKS